MAAEKHEIASLHYVEETRSEEDTRARTKTVITATAATNAMIANSGCQAIFPLANVEPKFWGYSFLANV